jgi:D-alanyl-D-alanine carboxypeptidase
MIAPSRAASRCLALALLLSGAALPAQTPRRLSPEAVARRAAALDSIAEAFRERTRAVGLSVAIAALDGRVLYARAYGLADAATRRPVTAATVFRFYSMGKPYTSAVAHRLAETGRLALDAPIGTWLATLPPWRDSITVRDLLGHTSGIVDYTAIRGYQASANAGRSEDARFVDSAVLRPLTFAPRSRWSYNNTNYALIGRIVERVTGRPYAAVLAQEVLAPAGLRETSDTCVAGEIPTGYSPAWMLGLPGDSLVASALRNAHNYDLAAGGLCATARDVARFYALLVGGRLVSATSLADMTQRPPGIGARSGAGLFVHEDDEGISYSHSGGGRNGSGEVFAFPRDSLVLVALTNIGGGPDYPHLLRALRREILGLPQPTVWLDRPLQRAEASSWLGTYVDPVSGEPVARLFDRDGVPVFTGGRLFRQPDGSLVPEHYRDWRIRFLEEPGRPVEMVITEYGVETRRGRRRP